MKDLKRLPRGRQGFEQFKKNNLIYVDKTDLLYNLVQDEQFVFLSRPRRFGKSLLVSTLKAYFEGRRDLFEGLKISSLEQEWKKYPVIHFDFSNTEYSLKKDLTIAIDKQLRLYEEIYSRDDKDVYVSNRFDTLIRNVYKQTGEQVVILVDEYDAPLLECPSEYLDAYKKTYSAFFKSLKTLEKYIRFVFLTGVTKFSQVSIFSSLNNLSDITLDDSYSTLCGITQEELIENFSPYIEKLALKRNLSTEECLIKLKDMYDGYHFSENSPGVYNPYSLLNCFSTGMFKSFWYYTGTPTFLVKMLLENNYDIRDYSEGFEYSAQFLMDSLTDNLELEQLLYQAGYLTIDNYDEEDDTFTLIYPNNEVKNAFSALCRKIMFNLDTLNDTNKAKALRNALNNVDVESLISTMKSILAGIPYTVGVTSEEHFRNYIYLIFTMRGQNISCEERTSTGRIDLTLLTKNYIYIIEIKKDKDAQEALDQINENCYADKYALDERKVIKIGIKFSSEKRNIVDHRVG